jgi:adenine-specific DNA-methyltransferase
MSNKTESKDYLSKQIITYIGNKRALLSFIEPAIQEVQKSLNKDRLDTFDVFSGSGIISRFFKQYSDNLYTNDMEDYSRIINACYLSNKDEVDNKELDKWFKYLQDNLTDEKLKAGFITELYSPADDQHIKTGERVFYKRRNAEYIDTARQLLDKIPEPYKTLLMGPLLYEASVKNNTGGVFKGFYKNSHSHIGQFGGDGKNALKRILADIKISKPVLSNFHCNIHVCQGDSTNIAKTLPKVDLAYLDPPYNQHPYGSNYFMLNLISNYQKPSNISKVSGIPVGWNKSDYNSKKTALGSLEKLVKSLNARFILISFSSEGFISYDEMVEMLKSFGDVKVFDHEYNVFRASRNLRERDIHLTEFLFLLRKKEEN